MWRPVLLRGTTISEPDGPIVVRNDWGFTLERDDGEIRTFRKWETAQRVADKCSREEAKAIVVRTNRK